jgi:hypothetical protein
MIFFKQVHKPLLLLLFLYVLLLSGGYLFVTFIKPEISFGDIAIQATVFSVISFITLIIFFRGRSKEPDSQTLYVLVAISLKFLLEIVFALIWLIVVKKNALPSVLLFFVLYLALTLFTILIILKTLKNKVL